MTVSAPDRAEHPRGAGPPALFRSLLFVPATNLEMITKAARYRPDVVVVDLEDAVVAEEKARARDLARTAIDLLHDRAPHQVIFLRINPIGTPWFEEDVSSVPDVVTGIVLPKAQTAEDIGVLNRKLAVSGRKPCAVIAGIETAEGVSHADELAAEPAVSALYFGAEDYITDLGGRRTDSGFEVLYARSHVAMCARLGRVAAIDQAVIDFSDDEKFTLDAEAGRTIGFHGKLCIHPRQVALAAATFSPSSAEISLAQRIVDAVTESGSGVTVIDGQMIDQPLVNRARAVLAAAGLLTNRT